MCRMGMRDASPHPIDTAGHASADTDGSGHSPAWLIGPFHARLSDVGEIIRSLRRRARSLLAAPSGRVPSVLRLMANSNLAGDDLSIRIDRGDPVLRRRLHDQVAVDQGISIRWHHQAATRRSELGDGGIDLSFGADAGGLSARSSTAVPGFRKQAETGRNKQTCQD
jgi:hypothetical protein